MNQSDSTLRHRILQAGAVRYDESLCELQVAGVRRSLEAKPLALLHTLLVHAGAIVTKRELMQAAWGNANHIAETSLTTAMSKLRAALGEQGRELIEVVHGIGYRIGAPVEVVTSQAGSQQAVPLGVGERVPGRLHWRLERLLGERGGRNTWLARHGKTGEARVFKFATTPAALETLRQEANLSRVLHATLGQRDDLVHIVDWDFEHPPYFIESAYGGAPLTQWAADGDLLATMLLAERLALVTAIARIVAAAHAACVLHGDIKPTNILVNAAQPGAPQLRLIDFGAGVLSDPGKLALLSIDLTTPISSLTSRNGTVGYVAPEILAGAQPTTAADIYALGILAYQLAVGDLTTMPGVGWQDRITDPLLRADITAATAADPERRLDSASAFAERLATLPARNAVRARQELEQRRKELSRLRRPWIIAAASSLCAALIVAIISAIHAGRGWDEARHRADTAQAVNDFLTMDLLGRGDPAQSGKPNESLMDAAQAAETGIDRRLAHDPLTAGSLYLALARAFDSRSAFDAARHAYDQAASAFNAAKDPGDAVITRLRQVLMEVVCGQAGAVARGETLLAAAGARLATLGPRQEEASTWYLAGHSLLQLYHGDLEAAQAGFRLAVERANRLPDRFDAATRLSLRRRLDFTYVSLGQWGSAETLLMDLLQDQIALRGPRDPETLHVQLNLVEVLLGSGKLAQAVAAADRIQPLFVAILGPDHRLTIDLLTIRAEALVKLERYDQALRDEMAVYEAGIAKYGAHYPKPYWMLTYAAQTQCRAGQIEAGLAAARNAYEKLRGEASHFKGAAAGNLAFCLLAAKDYMQASAYLDEVGAVSAAEGRLDPEYPALIALMRAEVAFSRSDAPEARRQLAAATPVFERPGADPYLQRWCKHLQALSLPIKQDPG